MVTVRKMLLSDLDAVIDLRNDIFEENDHLDKLFVAEFPYKLVSEIDGEITGTLMAYKNCNKYLIGGIIAANTKVMITVPGLINYLFDDAKERKFTAVYLEVVEGSLAKTIYDILGFKKELIRKNYYGHEKSEVMSKKI